MVTKDEVIEQYEIEPMDEADNVDLLKTTSRTGRRVSSSSAPVSCETDATS